MEWVLVYLNATNLHLHILHKPKCVSYNLGVNQSTRKPRSASNAIVLVAAGALSHHAAGGSFIAFAPVVLEFAILAAVLYLFSRKSLEGPKLAMLIVLSQGISHIAMGGNSKSGLPMALSHIGAGVLSYFYICNSEKFWELATDKCVNYFQSFTFVPDIIKCESLNVPAQSPERLKSHLSEMRLNWRGPPALN